MRFISDNSATSADTDGRASARIHRSDVVILGVGGYRHLTVRNLCSRSTKTRSRSIRIVRAFSAPGAVACGIRYILINEAGDEEWQDERPPRQGSDQQRNDFGDRHSLNWPGSVCGKFVANPMPRRRAADH